MKGRLCWDVVTATAIPKRSRDVTVKGRGSADEAVVVVKLEADEDAVTYLRVKLSVRGLIFYQDGGEGWNMLPRTEISLETVVMRSAIGAFLNENVYFRFLQRMRGFDDVAMQGEVK